MPPRKPKKLGKAQSRSPAQQGGDTDNPPSVGAASAAAAPLGQAISHAASKETPSSRHGDQRSPTAKEQLAGESVQVVESSQPIEDCPVSTHRTGPVAEQPTVKPGAVQSSASKESFPGASVEATKALGASGTVQGTANPLSKTVKSMEPTVQEADHGAKDEAKAPADAQSDLMQIFGQFSPESPEYHQTALLACQALIQAMTTRKATRLQEIKVLAGDKLKLPDAWSHADYDPRTFEEVNLSGHNDKGAQAAQLQKYLLHLVSVESRREYHALSMREALGPENTINWGIEVKGKIDQALTLPQVEHLTLSANLKQDLGHRCMIPVNNALQAYEMAYKMERTAHRHLLDAIDAYDERFPNEQYGIQFGAIKRRYWIDRCTFKDDESLATRFMEAATAHIYNETRGVFLGTNAKRPTWDSHLSAAARHTGTAFTSEIKPYLIQRKVWSYSFTVPEVPEGTGQPATALQVQQSITDQSGQAQEALSRSDRQKDRPAAGHTCRSQVSQSTSRQPQLLTQEQLEKLREAANDKFDREHTSHLGSDWEGDSQDSDKEDRRETADPDNSPEANERDQLRKRTKARNELKLAEAALSEDVAQRAPASLREALTTCGLKHDSQAGCLIRFTDIQSLNAMRGLSDEMITNFVEDHCQSKTHSDTFQGIVLEDLKPNLVALRQWVDYQWNRGVKLFHAKFYARELNEALAMVRDRTIANLQANPETGGEALESPNQHEQQSNAESATPDWHEDVESETTDQDSIPILDQSNWQSWGKALQRALYNVMGANGGGTTPLAYVLRPDPYVPEQGDEQFMERLQGVPLHGPDFDTNNHAVCEIISMFVDHAVISRHYNDLSTGRDGRGLYLALKAHSFSLTTHLARRESTRNADQIVTAFKSRYKDPREASSDKTQSTARQRPTERAGRYGTAVSPTDARKQAGMAKKADLARSAAKALAIDPRHQSRPSAKRSVSFDAQFAGHAKSTMASHYGPSQLDYYGPSQPKRRRSHSKTPQGGRRGGPKSLPKNLSLIHYPDDKWAALSHYDRANINHCKRREEEACTASDKGEQTPDAPDTPWTQFGIQYVYDLRDPTRIEPQYLTEHERQMAEEQHRYDDKVYDYDDYDAYRQHKYYD
jgi:hypothetical protein